MAGGRILGAPTVARSDGTSRSTTLNSDVVGRSCGIIGIVRGRGRDRG
ncbi:hypothetical protein KPATCC21470_8186 [Kitasatospora purpeofusca]